MPHTPMVEYEADADLRSALSLLEEWIDVTTAPARVHRPPAQVTPQLPVPPAPAESSLGTGGIVGRGLIIHAQADDYKTQPTGNAGARLACGVIKAG